MKDFVKMVKNMRKAQRQYFAHRTLEALSESKFWEKQVDHAIKHQDQTQLF